MELQWQGMVAKYKKCTNCASHSKMRVTHDDAPSDDDTCVEPSLHLSANSSLFPISLKSQAHDKM